MCMRSLCLLAVVLICCGCIEFQQTLGGATAGPGTTDYGPVVADETETAAEGETPDEDAAGEGGSEATDEGTSDSGNETQDASDNSEQTDDDAGDAATDSSGDDSGDDTAADDPTNNEAPEDTSEDADEDVPDDADSTDENGEQDSTDEGVDDNREEEETADDAEGIPALPDGLEEVTTASGLRYVDIEVGFGAQPQIGQMVDVHYTGWLEDGTKFDSSFDSGSPFTFTVGVGDVIPGWDEGVETMLEGGKRRLIVPPDLGYGQLGMPPTIPGDATLIFDVELVYVYP